MNKDNPLVVDLRNASKSDLLATSNNFRIISKIHDVNSSSIIIFILSIIVAILLGIIINIIFSLMEFSKEQHFTILIISALALGVLIYILILKSKKFAKASKLLDESADKILENYFNINK